VFEKSSWAVLIALRSGHTATESDKGLGSDIRFYYSYQRIHPFIPYKFLKFNLLSPSFSSKSKVHLSRSSSKSRNPSFVSRSSSISRSHHSTFLFVANWRMWMALSLFQHVRSRLTLISHRHTALIGLHPQGGITRRFYIPEFGPGGI
jgi:hypothetical protein